MEGLGGSCLKQTCQNIHVGALRRIRHCLPKHNIKIYHTLICPCLSCCNLLWELNYTAYHNHLFILQKRAIRRVLGQNARLTKWYGQNYTDKMIYGQYVIGQNGMNNMERTK